MLGPMPRGSIHDSQAAPSGQSCGPHSQRLGGLDVDPEGAGNVAFVVLAPRPHIEQAEIRLAEAMLKVVERHEHRGNRARLDRCRERTPRAGPKSR